MPMPRPPESPARETDSRRVWVRVLLLGAALLAAWALASLTPLKSGLERVPDTVARLQAAGIWAPVFFLLATTLLVALGVPRLLFCPIGGMAFGFWAGLLWTQAATLLGYVLTFLFARWAGRDALVRHRPRLGRFALLLDRQNILSVVLLRQLPVSGVVTNLLLGVSSVRVPHFLIGTAAGILPEAIPFTLLGSAAVEPSAERGALITASAVLLLIPVGLLLAWCVRRGGARVLERSAAAPGDADGRGP